MARTKKEIIEEYIENASDDEIIELGDLLDSWNGFLGDHYMWEDWESFFTLLKDPIDIARATFFGDIQSWEDDYIGFNAYGNFVSCSSSEYADRIKGCGLADAIIEDLDYLYNNLPRELQDELEANEDDDEGSYNKKPVKKSPAKKTPVKKSPAKKTPVKKSPAKKTPAKAKTSTKKVTKTAPKKTVKRK